MFKEFIHKLTKLGLAVNTTPGATLTPYGGYTRKLVTWSRNGRARGNAAALKRAKTKRANKRKHPKGVK